LSSLSAQQSCGQVGNPACTPVVFNAGPNPVYDYVAELPFPRSGGGCEGYEGRPKLRVEVIIRTAISGAMLLR